MSREIADKPKRAKDWKGKYTTPHWCIDLLAMKLVERLIAPDVVVDLGAGDWRIGYRVAGRFGTEQRRLAAKIYVDVDRHTPGIGQRDGKNVFVHGDGMREVIDSYPRCQDTISRLMIPEGRALFVSNPPFSQSEAFVVSTLDWLYSEGNARRHLAIGSAAVFLLRLDWLGTRRRAHIARTRPPDRISILVPRPSFAVGGGTDMREYGWFWWLKTGEPYQGTKIEVLENPKGRSRR